eukprot:TRINITY_DN10326_c0_g1_i2.p1 TRINITY_DN10326_c0_g1~~TRINITY_DN10326_c0_g1_i2.p1  ORF type:complete len:854 (+),score=127.18 TRINITY_DN10326_c0_g1_i2:236-2797(+)
MHLSAVLSAVLVASAIAVGVRDAGPGKCGDSECTGQERCVEGKCVICVAGDICGEPVCRSAIDHLYGPIPTCKEKNETSKDVRTFCPSHQRGEQCQFACGGFGGFLCPDGLKCVYGPECERIADCMGTCQKPKVTDGAHCPMAVFPDAPNYPHYEATAFENGCASDRDCAISGQNEEICAAEAIVSIVDDLKAPAANCQCINNLCQWTKVCREPICEPVLCDLYCENGFALDRNGCPTCACNGAWVGCPLEKRCLKGDVVMPQAQDCCEANEQCTPIDPDCLLCGSTCQPINNTTPNDNTCPLVFAGDENDFDRYEAPDADNSCSSSKDCLASGCNSEICAAEPLNSICSTDFLPPEGTCTCVNNRCAWTEPCKEPPCEPVRCRKYCEHGWAVDPKTGCEICECMQVDKCCDPLKEPGMFGNPKGREGHVCCPTTGEWGFNIGDAKTFVCDGQETTGPFGKACELPCDRDQVCPSKKGPGCCDKDETCINGECVRNVIEPCGYGDCAKWFDGCNTCQVDERGCLGACTKKFCPPEDVKPAFCETLRVPKRCVSFFDGCNSCQVVDGELTICTARFCTPEELEAPKCTAFCCDPMKEPGLYGNPPAFQGHVCCPTTGEWGFSIGDAKTFICNNTQTTGPFGAACPSPFGCRTAENAYRKVVAQCAAKDSMQACRGKDDDCDGEPTDCVIKPNSDTGVCCTLPKRRVNIKKCLKTNPPSCGGFLGTKCGMDQECVDDPRDECDPVKGGADCPGICCCQGKICDAPQKNCDKKCKKKIHKPAKYYWHGEYTKDKYGCDDRCKCEPCPKLRSEKSCRRRCEKRGKGFLFKDVERNGVKCRACRCDGKLQKSDNKNKL